MITDFATLQTEAADLAHRNDLADRMPSFIQLAEAEIFRDLALRPIETKVTGTTSGDAIALPAAPAQVQELQIEANGRRYALDYTAPTGVADLTASPDLPSRFTVKDGAILLLPAPAGPYNYTVFYVPLLTALSDVNATNWLLLNAPDVYLHATCKQVAIWSEDDALLTKHQQVFQSAMASVRAASERLRFPVSGGLQIKPRRAR